MIKRILNLLSGDSLYNDNKKGYIVKKLNYYLNNNFFTNNNIQYKKYKIGDFTYGKPEILFDNGTSKLVIGKYCSIGAGTKIFLGGNHRYDRTTSYPFHQVENISGFNDGIIGNGNIAIGNDVRIGMNVTIMSGVSIGDGAVIGYGSIVTKDIEPYSISGGFPAKFIKKRFSDQEIEELLQLKRWDYDHRTIMKHINALLSNDIKMFIRNFNNG